MPFGVVFTNTNLKKAVGRLVPYQQLRKLLLIYAIGFSLLYKFFNPYPTAAVISKTNPPSKRAFLGVVPLIVAATTAIGNSIIIIIIVSMYLDGRILF